MANYPALLELETGELHSLDKPAFVVGRSQQADLPVFDQQCARQHFSLVRAASGTFLESHSSTAVTRLNGAPILQRTAIAHGSEIEAGNLRFRFLERPESEPPPNFAPPPPPPPATNSPQPPWPPNAPPPPIAPQRSQGVDHNYTILAMPGADAAAPQFGGTIDLQGRLVLGRDLEKADIHLPHVHVSRLHAAIVRKGSQAEVSDLGTTNGTFVDGQRITSTVTIDAGARIDVGPYTLVFNGSQLIPSSRADNVQLACDALKKVVSDRTTGKPLVLLDDINLVVRPKEFVCILGPSGSGKSTLLGAMCARSPATSGRMLLNGQNLYANFDSLKQDLALVPQKNILHESLTVERALWYTARLRLPSDANETEVQTCVNEMLATVGLQQRRKIPLRSLSGGQMRRACLAGEIIAKPSLLFLDEVTSGLDEQTDGEMMALFRQIAESGKTVLCVTHTLAHVEEACHLVVILAVGGKLAFVGTPAEALQYFGISRLGQIYSCLAKRSADDLRDDFLRSPLHTRYIKGRTGSLERLAQPPVADKVKTGGWRERMQPFVRQTLLLLRRNFEVQLADRRALVMMLAQCLIVGALIVLISNDIQASDKNVVTRSLFATRALFLMAISCFWFGCNNSVKEIVKERPILEQERSVNLNLASYFTAKAFLLSAISIAQATLLIVVVAKGSNLPGELYWQWLTLSLLAAAGVMLGLLISAVSRTEDVAVTTVPIVLVPQIILASYVASLDGVALRLAQFVVTAYWGYRGLSTLVPDDYPVQDRDDISLTASLLVVALHCAVFSVATLIALDWDRVSTVLSSAVNTALGRSRARDS